MSAVSGFREGWMSSGTPNDDQSDFGDLEARRVRYSVLWAYLDNSVYRSLHSWADSLKASYGLYKYIRTIYNPSARIADFWQTHIWGGLLDPNAGDGQGQASAVPIITENPALRVALAALWQASNWQLNKDIVSLWGSVLGDVGLRVVDDVERGKVYLEVVHPSTVAEVTLDPFGNVKEYVIEEQRQDPRFTTERIVTYREEVTRDGQNVVFKTLLNKQPFAWNGITEEWAEPYGFAPLVLIQHNNVGLDWAWSELYGGLSKIREVDDIASKLSDQIRKTIDPAWLFSGVEKPKTPPTLSGSASTVAVAEPGRQEMYALYGPPGSLAHPLVAPLDVPGALNHIGGMLDELERDYPELQVVKIMLAGTSGRARLIAQQMCEPKVERRRANYDDGLRRAQQMAVAIAGYRGYAGFEGFGLDSYAAGALDHQIGKREVFAKTVLDDLEQESLFWATVSQAQAAGCPLPLALKRLGWSDAQVLELAAWRKATLDQAAGEPAAQ